MARLAIATACLACLCALAAAASCPRVCKSLPVKDQQACRNKAVDEQMKKAGPQGAVGTTCASRGPQFYQQCINDWVKAKIAASAPKNAQVPACGQACVNAAIDMKQAQAAAECAKALAAKGSKDWDDNDWDNDWDDNDWDDRSFGRGPSCTPFNGPTCSNSASCNAFMRRLGAQCGPNDQACINKYTLALQSAAGRARCGASQQTCLDAFVKELMNYARGKCVDGLGKTISGGLAKAVVRSAGRFDDDDDDDDRRRK